MSRSDLLLRLLLAAKALLGRVAGRLSKPMQKVLGILAAITPFLGLRSRCDSGRKPGGDDSMRPPVDPMVDLTVHGYDKELQAHSAKVPHIIALDSSISCARHPYPSIFHERSQSVLSLSGVEASRFPDAAATVSHQGPQSSPNLGLSQLGAQPWTDGSLGDGEDDSTFRVRSSEHSSSPVARHRLPVRGYSMPSPDLGSSANNHQIWGLEGQTSHTTSSSPPQSIQILDPEETRIGDDGTSDSVPQLFHQRIFPLPPEYFTRYQQIQYAEKKETELIIKPMTLEFNLKPHPPGWVPVLHPEGVLYWYNEDKKVVTESDLHDLQILRQATEDLVTIEDFIRTNRIQLPPNITLAFELTREAGTGTIITDYYYADHDTRKIFFLDKFEASKFNIFREVRGVNSLAHIQHELEAQYWHHIMLYPSTLPNVQEAASDMKDLVLHYIADVTTSSFSTSPCNRDELERLLNAVGAMQEASQNHHSGAASFISRTMISFARIKVYNWHGLPQRRLYSDQAVYATRKKRTWLIKLLSPLLFSAPGTHLRSLHKWWVDGMLLGPVWTEAIKKLKDEWQEFTLYATVLLNANVAFLAIQSIDTQEGLYRSPVQIASYISIVASTGSIVTGLLLVRQHRNGDWKANDAARFLTRSRPTLGPESLSIIYSLPYALLMWGMVSFLTAFAWHCFDPTDNATRSIVGAAWALFAVLVIWCVWVGLAEAEEPVAQEPTPASDKDSAKRMWRRFKDGVALMSGRNWNALKHFHIQHASPGSEQAQV